MGLVHTASANAEELRVLLLPLLWVVVDFALQSMFFHDLVTQA